MSVELNPKLVALVLSQGGDSYGSDRIPDAVTGVCFSRPYLHFATLRLVGEAKFKLVRKGCAAFWFCERNPKATRELEAKVKRFVSKDAERKIVLRCTDLNGQYAGGGLAFKAEALLDLAVGSSLLLARTSSVSRWVQTLAQALPEPVQSDLPRQWYNGQLRAIETAAYLLAGGKVIEAGELSETGELQA
jgi:hypothetical protein